MFEVYRSTFNYWRQRSNTINPEHVQLRAKVREAFGLSGGSAGARSISAMLNNDGIVLSRYRAGRLMKELGLVSKQPSAPQYKKANNEHLAVKNKLDRQFAVSAPNQVWCGDVTYIWIGKRWAYLAVVLDLFSRNPVGWALSLSPDSQLTRHALINAYESRDRPNKLMFHSDQGMHYTSHAFKQILWRYQINQSMSRRGNCWDNAPMERFFRSFKSEWMPKYGYSSFAEAKQSITSYITGYYRQIRPHQYNAGKSPSEAERLFWKAS